MPKYKPAGEEATFTIKVKQVKAGSSYTLEICQVGSGTCSVLKTLTGTWDDSSDEKDGVPITISGPTATVRWKAEGPPPDGDRRSWRVLARIKVTDAKGKERQQTSQELEVYNDWLEVESVRDDGSPVKNASFKLLVNKRTHTKETTGEAGKVKVEGLPPGPVKLEWQKPYSLDKYVEEKATSLKAQLRVAKRASIVWPRGTDKKPHKQFVNLPADDKAPNQGSKVTLRLKLEDGVAGDKIYVRQSFAGTNSKRNDVQRGLAGAACTEWAPEGGVVLTLGDAPEVTVDLEVGKAGGDKVAIEVGGTDACKDAKVTIQNWRRLWYQISAPEGTEPPGMQRLVKCLADVFVDYVETKERVTIKETDAGMPAGSWFDAKLLGGKEGQRYLNVGTHNRDWFHGKYFKGEHAPHECHVLFAHTQMDAKDQETKVETIEEGDLWSTTWSDGKAADVYSMEFSRNVFPIDLKDGTKAFKSGSWEEVGGARKGNLTEADIRYAFPKRQEEVDVRLPDGALKVLEDGKKVKLTLTVATMLGTYLGEAQREKQLIATHARDGGARTANSTVNDVMAHELGHTLSQAVTAGSEPPGLKHADHGRQYTGKGHQGSHCADGLSDEKFKTLSSFEGLSKCRCIMFGENNQDGSQSNGKYCGRCKPYLLAQSMDSIA